MKEIKIRLLKAEEIECRIGTINEKGLSLLLYKDARVDQKILDETFGIFGWQRKHSVLDGNLYCTVSLWDEEKKQWIEKQDVGTASNMEQTKGEASDSFKRACFSVGIGRELYTAPFIWIPAMKCHIQKRGEKFYCTERFRVATISYGEHREIQSLVIVNSESRIIYTFITEASKNPLPNPEQEKKRIENSLSPKQVWEFQQELKRTGVRLEQVLERYQVSSFQEMSQEDYKKAMNILKKIKSAAA